MARRSSNEQPDLPDKRVVPELRLEQSSNLTTGTSGLPKPAIVPTPKPVYNNTVNVRSKLGPTQIIWFGSKSKRRYEWNVHTPVVAVNREDVDELLTKKLHNNPCCGGQLFPQANYVFELA